MSRHTSCRYEHALAGQLVPYTAGKPLPKFAQEALFGPLGMVTMGVAFNVESPVNQMMAGVLLPALMEANR